MMALSLRAADPDPGPFYFQAEGVRAQDLAIAISDHYQVSVLVHGEVSERPITGRLVCTNVTQAVESFCFLLGVKWRKEGDRIYLLGGKAEKTVTDFDSYGLSAVELGPFLGEGRGGLVGGRLVVEADQVRASEIKTILESVKVRPSLVLELFVVACSLRQVDRVNEWLESFKVGASYFQNSAVPYLGLVPGGSGSTDPDSMRARGFNYRIDASALLDFVNVERGIKVELREQVQVMSGGSARFSSGDVITETVYTTVPGAVGSQQLVSQYNRRTVGLVLDLKAVQSGADWFIDLDLQDSNLTGNSERTTSYEGSRLVSAKETGFFLLASFTRKGQEETKDVIKVFAGVPVLKSIFRKGGKIKEDQSVMVLARVLGKAI